jgi:hypothetical protein
MLYRIRYFEKSDRKITDFTHEFRTDNDQDAVRIYHRCKEEKEKEPGKNFYFGLLIRVDREEERTVLATDKLWSTEGKLRFTYSSGGDGFEP